jgi:hypothetical protein
MQAPTLNRWMLRHPMLLKAVGLTAVTTLIILGVIVPTFTRASELSQEIEIKKKDEAELTEKVSILTAIDQDLLLERVTILDLALPPRKDVVLYLSTIDGLSRELGLSFAGISLAPGDVTEASESAQVQVGKKVQAGGLQTLETEIKLGGSKERIYDFLRALENTFPLMQVKDVKVSAGGIEENYNLSVRLGMLWATRDVSEVKGQVSLFTEEEEEYFQQLAGHTRYVSPELEVSSEVLELGKFDLFEPTPQQSESQAPQTEVQP